MSEDDLILNNSTQWDHVENVWVYGNIGRTATIYPSATVSDWRAEYVPYGTADEIIDYYARQLAEKRPA